MAKGFKSGGRKPGSKNKITADVREAAALQGPAAIGRLTWLMNNAESHQTQAFAAEKLLDRGFGKAAQPHTGEGGQGPVAHTHKVILSGAE